MLSAFGRAARTGLLTSEPKAPALPSEADSSCPEAWRYETSVATRNAVCCSRRAGKTFAGRRRAVRVACATPRQWVHVVSLIRRNAKKHWWTGIKALLHELGWRPQVWETDMILKLENGSHIQALGVDDEADVRRLQGDYSNLIIGDEAHLPHDNVQRAFFAAAVPMLADYGGAFDWLGLPPEVEPTEFSSALDNPEWSQFHWDMFDHDRPSPREDKLARVERDLKQRGLTWEHPEALRTYRGIRVRDPATTAYEYQRGRNDYDPATVDFDRPGWVHSAGLDLGFQDRDALVVLAWRYDDPERRAYVRLRWQRNHLSTDSLYEVVASAKAVYRPAVWTGDHGGHGAVKVLETLSERLRVDMGTKPPDVMVSVGLVNDDLRTGRLLLPTSDVEAARVARAMRERLESRPEHLAKSMALLTDDAADLGAELAQVAKTANPRTKRVEINKTGYHSDLSEALRYAHHGAQNWRARLAQPEMSEDELRRRRRALATRREATRRW